LTIQGLQAGTIRNSLRHCQTPTGLRLLREDDMRFAFIRQASRMEHFSRLRILADENGTPLRLKKDLGQVGQPVQTIQAGRVGQEMVTIRGPEIHRVVFEAGARIEELFIQSLVARDTFAEGSTRVLRIYSSRSAGYVDVRFKRATRSTIDQAGLKLLRTSSEDPGTTGTLDVNEHGLVTRDRSEQGELRFTARLLATAPAERMPEHLPDISSFLKIETIGSISDPDQLLNATFSIKALPKHIVPAQLEGPGQQAELAPDGALTIRSRSQWPPATIPFPIPKIPPALTRWLAPTGLVQSKHPAIARLAHEQTAGAKNAWQAAVRLRNWVAKEIEADWGLSAASASEVLSKRKGDCSENAVLLVALARSAGIPARAVVGLAFSDGAFGGHMWTEVWVGAWQPIDSALGPERVSAARIRLSVDPLELGAEDARATALMAVTTAGVRIQVVETAPQEPIGSASPPHRAPARAP
jgi:hypothetical protein